MIDIIYSDWSQGTYTNNLDEIGAASDIVSVQVVDANAHELAWINEHLSIDLVILNHATDIEISSHFINKKGQISMQLSVPYYNEAEQITEATITFFLTKDRLVYLLDGAFKDYMYKFVTFNRERIKNTPVSFVKLLMEITSTLADYYADITELIGMRIKKLASMLINHNAFDEKELDLITRLKYANLLIRESTNEFMRIIILLKKTEIFDEVLDAKASKEISDLTVISEYLQFNFDRLQDLENNISNKITVEQNRVFKYLTIITACFSLPALIAGIYGMNFSKIPASDWNYGFVMTIVFMIISILLPLWYFKRKGWL